MTPRAPGLLALLILTVATATALEFRVLSWSGPVRGLKYQDGAGIVEISARDDILSRPYRLAGDLPPAFFRETVGIDGRTVRVPVATPVPPEGLKRGILVLAPLSDGLAYGGDWIDDVVETNPAGTIRFLNYTGQPLALKTSAGQWLQPPGQSKQVSFDPARRAVAIQVAARSGADWQRVVNVSQPVRAGHRLLVLLCPGRPNPGLPTAPVELRVFHDQ